MHQLYKVSVFCITLLFASSCQDKKEETLLDCGCRGPVYKTVEDEQASYLGNGYFVIGTGAGNEPLIYAWACEIDTTLVKSPNQYSRDYKISGNLKKGCPVNDIVFPIETPTVLDMLDVTAISRK
jgi:hypothetical protein